jgi:hypothetical protein
MTEQFESQLIRVTSPDGLHVIDYFTRPDDLATPKYSWDEINNKWIDANPPPTQLAGK